MSAPAPTVSTMQEPAPSPAWNPIAELGRRAHLTIVWIDRGRRGCIDFAAREIQLRRSMRLVERRCVLSHELIHDERGPVPKWMTAREEAAVRQESARRLIVLEDLARALQWSPFITEVAEELDVDVPTLQARLTGLTDDERDSLATLSAHHELDAEDVPT